MQLFLLQLPIGLVKKAKFSDVFLFDSALLRSQLYYVDTDIA
jgi:hypothetical protein